MSAQRRIFAGGPYKAPASLCLQLEAMHHPIVFCALFGVIFAFDYGVSYSGYNASYLPQYIANVPADYQKYYYEKSFHSHSHEKHCKKSWIEDTACPSYLTANGLRCSKPEIRTTTFRGDGYNEQRLDLSCGSTGRIWTALVTELAQVITASRGIINHSIKCSNKKDQWQAYNATGHKIYFESAFCVSGVAVDTVIYISLPQKACTKCPELRIDGPAKRSFLRDEEGCALLIASATKMWKNIFINVYYDNASRGVFFQCHVNSRKFKCTENMQWVDVKNSNYIVSHVEFLPYSNCLAGFPIPMCNVDDKVDNHLATSLSFIPQLSSNINYNLMCSSAAFKKASIKITVKDHTPFIYTGCPAETKNDLVQCNGQNKALRSNSGTFLIEKIEFFPTEEWCDD